MDATVDSFFDEINAISSKKEVKPKEEVWQECYDELTGYSYFWNTENDEVTWVPPKSYKPAENAPKKGQPKIADKDKKNELFMPPANAAAHLSASLVPEKKVKVYSIQDTIKKPEEKQEPKKKAAKKCPKFDDSDDEKIELITEYGSNSDSDADDKPVESEQNGKKDQSPVTETVDSEPLVKNASPERSPIIDNKSRTSSPRKNQSDDDEDDDDDDIDLLQKIQQRAQELKKLGGEVPASVQNIIEKVIIEDNPKPVSAFALVAGYNSDSEGDSDDPLPPPPPPKPETSHSTLFPITKPIDVKDFIGPDVLEPIKNQESSEEIIDNKVFQRKRRIGVSLVNSKRPKQEEEVMNEDGKLYPAFQKSGTLFVKGEVLNAEVPEEVDGSGTEEDYMVLREKLLFLGEGREPVLPIQTMLIQAETLHNAMKEGGLKMSYLHKWLKGMCLELTKLEKGSAPEGWLLQWDRSHKRYFYQNQTTGVSQWHYPEPDVVRCDDAMDISTTPPPADLPGPEVMSRLSPIMFGPQLPPPDPPLPPSPPVIRSPTPPPPPIIGGYPSGVNDVPLPPATPAPSNSYQPLPPGVDMLPDIYRNKPTENKDFSSALDSFYSEIADVTENPNSLSPPAMSLAPEVAMEDVGVSNVEVAKKKKRKTKLAQGLSMKKKGVSQLVEKWKSVQKNYD